MVGPPPALGRFMRDCCDITLMARVAAAVLCMIVEC
jgi:hypothetical protein